MPTQKMKYFRPEIDIKLRTKIHEAALIENKQVRQWLSELLQDYFGRMDQCPK